MGWQMTILPLRAASLVKRREGHFGILPIKCPKGARSTIHARALSLSFSTVAKPLPELQAVRRRRRRAFAAVGAKQKEERPSELP